MMRDTGKWSVPWKSPGGRFGLAKGGSGPQRRVQVSLLDFDIKCKQAQ